MWHSANNYALPIARSLTETEESSIDDSPRTLESISHLADPRNLRTDLLHLAMIGFSSRDSSDEGWKRSEVIRSRLFQDQRTAHVLDRALTDTDPSTETAWPTDLVSSRCVRLRACVTAASRRLRHEEESSARLRAFTVDVGSASPRGFLANHRRTSSATGDHSSRGTRGLAAIINYFSLSKLLRRLQVLVF